MYPLIGRHGGGGGHGGHGGGGGRRGGGAWRQGGGGRRRPGMRRNQGGGWYGWWPSWPYGLDLTNEYVDDEVEESYAIVDPRFAGYPAAQAQAQAAQAAQVAQEDAMVGAARALAEPGNELVSLLPAIGPRSGISCCMDFDETGHLLRVTVTVDGQTYQACTDLSAELCQIAQGVSAEHDAAHMARGASPPPASSSPAAVSELSARADEVVKSAGIALVGALYDQHANWLSGGWFDSVTDAVGWIAAPVAKITAPVGKVVGKTLQKFKGPISVAAGAIATVYGGPVGGMAASQLTGPLIDSLAETGGDPTEFVKGIKRASGGDPKVDEALALAQRAASHATAAYHLTDTADRAVAGDQDAARKVAEIDSLAGSGDLAATQAMQIIAQALMAKFGGAGASTVSGGFAGVTGPSSRSNRSRGRLRELRREAQDAAREAITQFGGGGGVVGFVRYDDGGTSIGPSGHSIVRQQTVVTLPFSDTDAADNWFGEQSANEIVYAAYFDATDPIWPQPLNEKIGHGSGAVALALPDSLAPGGTADQIVRQFAADLHNVAQSHAPSGDAVAVQGLPWLPLLAAAAAGGGAGWYGRDWWGRRQAAAAAAAEAEAKARTSVQIGPNPPTFAPPHTTSAGIGILPWLAVAAAGGAGWYGRQWWAERAAKAAAEAAAAAASIPPPSPQEVPPHPAQVATSGWW